MYPGIVYRMASSSMQRIKLLQAVTCTLPGPSYKQPQLVLRKDIKP